MLSLVPSGRNDPIARNLRALRDQHEGRQVDLEAFGVTQPMMSRYENGRQTPKPRTLVKIALAYNVDVSVLLRGVDALYDSRVGLTTSTSGPVVKQPPSGQSKGGDHESSRQADPRVPQLEAEVQVLRTVLARLRKLADRASAQIDGALTRAEGKKTAGRKTSTR